jgi:two-component sensor histidine kinase
MALPVVLRLAAGVGLVLGLAALGISAGLGDLHLQLMLLAVVLSAALLFGTVAGVVGATAGFAALVWRGLEDTGEGWSLGLPALLDAFLWFALAKLTAALVAAPRRLVARLAEAREEAEAEARRRALLLGEMSHRVMNDLQRLAGLLQSQARTEPAAAEPLRAAASRVQVLGRLQHRLSTRGAGAEADSRPYIEAVVEDLRAGLAGSPVALTVSAESHPLPLAAAGDLGLALNELVTNALKHAFPGGRAGTVRVAFRREAESGLYALAVADNGAGFRATGGGGGLGGAAEPGGHGGGFGSRLVRALAAQLGGRVEASSGQVGGSVVTLRFPPPVADAVGVDDGDWTEAEVPAPPHADAAWRRATGAKG